MGMVYGEKSENKREKKTLWGKRKMKRKKEREKPYKNMNC